jgi:hypothetical protein
MALSRLLGGGPKEAMERLVWACDWCHDAGVVVVDFLLKVKGWEMVGAEGHLGRGRDLRRGCRNLGRGCRSAAERLQTSELESTLKAEGLQAAHGLR